MQGYMNIKEASQMTGKHPDTIRRLIRDNKNSKHIAKDKKGRIIINTDWLLNHFEALEAPETTDNNTTDNQPTPNNTSGLEAVLEALTAQLQAKDTQIAQLQHIISEKEANTTKLQDQFQQLLATAQLPAQTQSSQTYEADIQQPQAAAAPTSYKPKKPQSRGKSTKKQVKKSAPKNSSRNNNTQNKPLKTDTAKKNRWWRR